jgi:hypothetical protein
VSYLKRRRSTLEGVKGKVVPVLNYLSKHYVMKEYGRVDA